MVRSCSITRRSRAAPKRRDMQIDQSVAGIAWRRQIDFVFVHRGAAMAHLLDQREQRAAERHEIAQHLPAQQQHRRLEEVFRGDIGVGDPALGVDDNDRQRQRVEHRIRGAERRPFAERSAASLMPPPASKRVIGLRQPDPRVVSGFRWSAHCRASA